MSIRKSSITLLILLIPSICFALDVPLQWDHACDCTGFRIYRSQGSADWPELVGTVQCPTKTFTDTDVPHGDLGYVVTAYNDVAESSASNAIELAYYYALTRMDYDATGRLIYRGENDDIAANDSDTDWVITKYYYSASGSLIEMRVRVTSWTDRATGW